jgi:hypothetical protein
MFYILYKRYYLQIAIVMESVLMSKYHLFISHASKDKYIVSLIAKDLKEFEYSVWYDSDEIEGGEREW